MLRKAFRDAVRWGLIRTESTAHADPPPARVVRAARKASMATWTHAELRRFLASAYDHPLHVAWLFASMTGVRRSELLGLTWPDVDLDRATSSVRRTVVQVEGGYELREAQKSDTSARTIHLDQRTVRMLRRRLDEQAAIRRDAGAGWNPEQLVFPRPDGSWWNPPAITLAFGRAVKRAPVPSIRLHDLRHTHASLLLAAGVNPKVVSERLGHSSVSFTLDTYAHVMPGMQPEAAALFERLVFGEEAVDDGTGTPEPLDDVESDAGEAPQDE